MSEFEEIGTDREILEDLDRISVQCTRRRISHVALFTNEMMLHCLKNCPEISVAPSPSAPESVVLRFVQSCVDNREFDRAAFFAEQHACKENTGEVDATLTFLLYYTKYLAHGKRQVENSCDVGDESETVGAIDSALLRQLEVLIASSEEEGCSWVQYLYGLMLKNCKMNGDAVKAFVRSIQAEPAFFGAWKELSLMIDNTEQLDSLLRTELPKHWLRPFFIAEVYIRLHYATAALDILLPLSERTIFTDNPLILQKLSTAYYDVTPQGICKTIDLMKRIEYLDPNRLEGMDLYSNSLYVQQMRVELATLAHRLYDLDKYRPETCCVVGNYFGLRGDHERAIQMFQRALKLDPKNAGAWVLIGHEFLELSNQSAATLAYRRAVEIEPMDCRAWYALGQFYEMSQMFSWALYYHRQAHRMSPKDSRFLVALGVVHEKLDQPDAAIRAYWKAHSVGDLENGKALMCLAQLFETRKEKDNAANAYLTYLDRLEEMNQVCEENQGKAYRFLAQYWTDNNELADAQHYAQLCLQHQAYRDEANQLLRRIEEAMQDPPDPQQIQRSLAA